MRRALFIAVLAAGGFAAVSAMAQPGDKPAALETAPVGTDAGATAASPGKPVFDRWCAACHADGARYPGTASLAVKYGKDAPAPLEQRTDLTPETVSYFVRHGVLIMPPFRKTEITDAELKALGDYLGRHTAR